MSKKFARILACGVLGSVYSVDVQAFPVSSPTEQVLAPDVTLVRGFCGLGFHRGPYGHCVRNGTSYVYPPPVYATPDRVLPLACTNGYFHLFPYSGCFAPACTYGYYLGPYGQCFPYWRAIM
jgi:hypothetical protein